MSEIEKYKKYLNFKANPRYLTRDFIVPLYTGTEPDIYDTQEPETEVDPGMVIPPQDVLPKNPEPVMPFAPGIPNPQDRILELADGGSVERQGFGKGSPPPGYITGKELEELTGIPNLSVKAKELMYAPKEYKRQKNIFGNFYKKELKAKYFDIGQGGKYGTLHYKTPTAEQIETMKAYHSRRGAKYGVTQGTANRMKLFHNNPKLRNYVRNGKIIPDELLKDYNITRNEAAQTTFRLAQAYNGKKFTNVDVGIPENKRAGKKLFEAIDKSPFGNPYKIMAYKEALNTITEGIGDKYFEKTTFEDMKREARRILQKEKIAVFDPTVKDSKGININELTGVTASSRNKSYPYSQFINLMEGNLNTKNYAGFNKQFEKYEKNLQNEIAKGNKGDPNKIIKEYKNYTKDFLSGLEDVDKAQIEKLGLPELSLKQPIELYGKKRTTQLLEQGLDLPGSYKELGYSIKVPKGTSTLKEFINNPEIRDQMIANIGCPTLISKSLGGRVNFSNGSNCYAKGLEKIQSGELGNAERRIAGQFLKEAGVGDELVKGMLTGGKNTLKVFQELALGTGPIGTLIGTTLTVPFAAAESARGSPGGFGRELVSSLIENVNIIPGVDIDAAKLAGTQVTQALERSARPGSQKMANYLFPIQEQSKEIDNLNKKLERFIYLRDNPSIESSPVSDQQVKMIQEQIDEKKLTLQNLTNNLKKNITGEDLNDVKKDITALQAEAFKRGKNIADLRISNVANPEIKKYVQENPNRIVLNAENIPTFINNLSNEYGESARPLIDQITKNFENIKTLGQQGQEETGILSPSGFIDVTDIYNDFLKRSEGYKTILDKQDLETKPLTEDQRISIEEMGARGGAAEGGRIELAGGGGPKMGRRGFLGLLTGAAAAPELIKAIKGEKKAVQAAKIASKIKFEKTEGMYPWFPDLVEKIKTKGKPFEEKEIIMEASYKHEPKGYGGLPKGVETVTRHVDGDTEFLLREYPDGRIAVDIHSPRNQEGSSTPVTLYYRPTMELKYYSGVKVEPAEFKVLEKEPRYFANGPDDVDIEMSETRKIPGKNTIYGDVEAAERFATGKIENRKIIPAKQARREQMEDAPTDFIEETSPYGPVYD
jgi:hypothetical protein